jgi:hypothetical protein
VVAAVTIFEVLSREPPGELRIEAFGVEGHLVRSRIRILWKGTTISVDRNLMRREIEAFADDLERLRGNPVLDAALSDSLDGLLTIRCSPAPGEAEGIAVGGSVFVPSGRPAALRCGFPGREVPGVRIDFSGLLRIDRTALPALAAGLREFLRQSDAIRGPGAG